MKALVAQFETPGALISAAKKLKAEGRPATEAFTPFPIEEAAEALNLPQTSLKWIMGVAGFGMAALTYGLEWYSSVIAYPYDSGSRPLNSWPVFLLVPFEVGILSAGVAGFIAFLYQCGLPRLHHPAFDIPGIERASDDRFFLAVHTASDEAVNEKLRDLLKSENAVSIEEAEL